MNKNHRQLIIWAVVGVFFLSLMHLFQSGTDHLGREQMSFSGFLDAVEHGQVQTATIRNENTGNSLVSGTLVSGRSFEVLVPFYPQMVDHLLAKGVNITAESPQESIWKQLLYSAFPVVLLVGLWILFMRHMQGAGGRTMGFGRSKAKELKENQQRITFDDVAGIDEAKEEVEEVVEFLRDPKKFQRLGGRIPRGVLLVGPPGTGKTLLARAIAGEADVPFFSISGSDFVEMFVGVGASRVRDLFEQGKKNAPCIIFIDEVDAVGRHRGAGMGGGNDEREQTLNQILVEMDGFEGNEGVILIAATNRPDILDPALLRPGRFDRKVVVPNPDVGGREKILNVHMKKVKISKDVDAKVLAQGTPGFSGADLANFVNEAALLAARRNRRSVSMAEFELAKDKVMMGAERRSLAMSEAEKTLTAYHEGGHALVGLYVPDCDPIHKATIVPRGRALGMVMRLPERDRLSHSKAKLRGDLAVAMGGRVAEELIFGADKVTSGASSDISMATEIARSMVTEWGMSDALGPVRYSGDPTFLGQMTSGNHHTSEQTAQVIDAEVQKLVGDAYTEATRILTENLDQLHILAKALLEYETLSGDEIRALLKGETIHRPEEPVRRTRPSVPTTEGGKAAPSAVFGTPQVEG